jgi:DNA-binding GntR family transcriptional regulator
LPPVTRRPDTTGVLPGKALDAIRAAIINRELLPGEPVRADVIAAQLGISRIPVREGLRILEAEGLVVSIPNKGMTVAKMTPADIHEIYFLRRILETEAARRAVPALDAHRLEQLHELVREMDRALAADDLVDFFSANRRFHFTISEASGMSHLMSIIRTLWHKSDAYRSLYLADHGHRERVHGEHLGILEACQRRDVEQVIRLLDEHREHAEASILAVLDEAPQRGAAA